MAIRRSKSSYKHFNSDTYSSTYRSTKKLNKKGDFLIESGGESGNKGNAVQVTRESTYNGTFVSNIFLLLVIFLIVIGVYGVASKEPMDIVKGVALKVSNYGEGFTNDLKRFSDFSSRIRVPDTNSTWVLHFVDPNTHQPFDIDTGITPSRFNQVLDGIKFLLTVPIAIGMLAVRFIWLVVEIIGVCLL